MERKTRTDKVHSVLEYPLTASAANELTAQLKTFATLFMEMTEAAAVARGAKVIDVQDVQSGLRATLKDGQRYAEHHLPRAEDN